MQVWTESLKGDLAPRWLQGKPAREVAREMGLSRGAAASMATQLGLPPTRHLRDQPEDAWLRPCMCCGAEFYSAWKDNRLCMRCNGEA